MVRIGKLLLVLFLFIIVLGLGSSASAWTFNDMIDYCNQIKENPNAPSRMVTVATEFVNHAGSIQAKIGNPSSILLNYKNGSNWFDIRYTSSNINNSKVNQYSTLQWDSMNWNLGTYVYSNNTWPTFTSNNFTSAASDTWFGLVDIPSAVVDVLPNSYWLQNKFEQGPNVTFEFEPRFYRNIDISGESFYCYNYSRSVSLWTIGYCHGLSDYNYVGGDLYVFVDTNVLDNIGGFIYRSEYLIQNGVLNITPYGLLSVNQSKILYNQGYALNFFLRDKEGNSYWLDEPIYLYFKPLGDSSNSGDLISPDLDNNTDVGFVNLLDDYFASPSGNTEYEISGFLGFPSGDFSGDMFGILGSVDLSRFNDDYGTGTYLRQIFLQVINSLAGEGNQQLIFEIHGRTYTINSNDFVVPNGVFKSFITMLLVAGTLLLIYWQVRGILLSFRTLNLTSAVRSFDVDYSLFM